MKKKIFKRFTPIFVASGLIVSSTTAFAASGTDNLKNQNAFGNINKSSQSFEYGWGKTGDGLNGHMGNQMNNGNANFFGGMGFQNNSKGFPHNGFYNKAIEEIAENLDIDTSQMTIDEVIEKIKAQLDDLSDEELEVVAEELDIDVDDLTDDEIIEEIEDKLGNLYNNKYFDKGYLKELVDLLDIDTSGLTIDEIIDEISDSLEDLSDDELEAVAEELDIDVDDLSSDEIIEEIEDKLDNLCASSLEQVANVLDIDDLDDDEIVDEINDELDTLSVDKLLRIAQILNVDIIGLTSDEIIADIEEKLAELE